jgi:hypothetical protein
MARPTKQLAATKNLMAAMLGMKPKHHEDMKLGKKANASNKRRKNAKKDSHKKL